MLANVNLLGYYTKLFPLPAQLLEHYLTPLMLLACAIRLIFKDAKNSRKCKAFRGKKKQSGFSKYVEGTFICKILKAEYKRSRMNSEIRADK